MAEAKSSESFERPEHWDASSVWAERSSTRSLVGYNQRGVSIRIGKGEGEISPGELLKLALIGCAGMSLDHPTSRRLGEDFALRIYAHGAADPHQDRYLAISEQIQLDMDGLDEHERGALAAVIERAIDAACTVKRTVEPGVPVEHSIIDARSKH